METDLRNHPLQPALAAMFKALTRVDPHTGCHHWTGPTRGKNAKYGNVYLCIPGLGRMNTGAHRLAWRTFNGHIPTGKLVCHHCDTPPCVNPDHLFVGTTMENAADMVSKYRSRKGVKNNHAKFTEKQILAIRAALADGATQVQLAEKYGVTQGCIQFIYARKTWAHI